MTDQPGPTPPSAPDQQSAPPWGGAPPAVPPALPVPPAYGVPLPYQAISGTQTHQGALWSMILGIIGLVSGVLALPTSGVTAIGMICSPVAFGLGLSASKAVRDRPDVYNNRGHATAGWIMGLIGMVLGVLALLLVLALLGLFLWLLAEFAASEGA